MSKGSKAPQVTTQENKAPAYIQPSLQYALDKTRSLYDNPNQIYQGQRVVDFNPVQTEAINNVINRARGGSDLNRQAISQTQAMARGDFLNSNPYLNNVISDINQQVIKDYTTQNIPQVEATFARAGRSGSGYRDAAIRDTVSDLQKNLAKNTTGILANNYSVERQNQINAINQLPQLANIDYIDQQNLLNAGGLQRDLEKEKLQAEISKFYEGQAVNQDALNQFIDRINAIRGNDAVQQVTQPRQKNNWLSQALGIAGAAAGTYFGGPAGGAAGYQAGSSIGGALGGSSGGSSNAQFLPWLNNGAGGQASNIGFLSTRGA